MTAEKVQKKDRVLYRYPSSHKDIEAKEREFDDLWPKLESLYRGDHLELFKKFSAIVHKSFTGMFFSNLTPEQCFYEFLYYFDFFMEDFQSISSNGKELPGALLKVQDPPKEVYSQESGKIAFTGILIHAVDSPFIVENLIGYLDCAKIHVFSSIHPVVTVKRENGKVVDILPPEDGGSKEVFIKFRIQKIINPEKIAQVEKEIWSVLEALFLSVSEFDAMAEAMQAFRGEISEDTIDPGDAVETAEFLNWLVPSNFISMGMARFDIVKKGKSYSAKRRQGANLGVFHNRELMNTVFPRLLEDIEETILSTFQRRYMMVFDFLSHAPSIIYHREPVDVVIVRQFGKDGIPVAATVLIGRLARGAKMSKASTIPFLRKKLDRIFEAEKILPHSYLNRELTTAFNHMPKRELFYIDRATLSAMLHTSASLQSDDEFHLIFRHNRFLEYLTAVLIFSAKKYSSENIVRVKEYFRTSFDFEMVYDEVSQTGPAMQMFIYFRVPKGTEIEIDIERVGKEVSDRITTWDQHVMHLLVDRLGDQDGFLLFNRYINRLTDLYRQAVRPVDAVPDILRLEEVERTSALQLEISVDTPTSATLRICWDRELDLMKLIPTFKNLDIFIKDELALPLHPSGEKRLFVQLLKIEDTEERIAHITSSKERLIEAIRHVIHGTVEDCPLNHLVISAGFDWRQVNLVRGYVNYLLQINSGVNPNSVTAIVNKYPTLVAKAVEYFLEKFDPGKGDAKKMEAIKDEYEKGLAEITDLTEDSILRHFFNIMENTLRTNYFKPLDEYYLSFKLNCPGIMFMPKPVPMAEIYVHTPNLEGVHLRGGKVARGGLRWSDRPDDFRTEILGLVKTQRVKNSVIVPVGSKGGFYIKRMKYTTREERDAAFKKLYQTFISGLLDLTDNLVDGEPVRPENVVCYDEHDPYLVVAADKGTATMSDSANEISKDKYGFWLGDAFASGGAEGYDHKKFGITARGAWECIKRHFRERGIDIQTEPVTVVGVGDMAGDVFGNGMLLSRKIKLVAAFNHVHIFLDPDPDPEQSFKERERLFATPGTSWMDYDKGLISAGGGIFHRAAKSIPISRAMQKLLQVEASSMSGQELIRAILSMPVDLLYSGGIGTYVRASSETNLDVGDKANDPVRITATQLRARVVGEGANLSLTQLARIEYAARGGVINTDFIDNSAGVDISDHEVNFKILLEIMLQKGELKDEVARNTLFAQLGPEIAELVLQDNYNQSAGMTLDQRRSERSLETFCDYIDDMTAWDLLDREDEDIPDRETLEQYAKEPGHLLRPILALLFGYEKMRLFNVILESPLVNLAFSEQYLHGYFPPAIQRDYATSLGEHRLKKEIVATIICNKIVNQAGVSFIYKTEKATGLPPWEVCRAYLIVENLLCADEYRKMINELDNVIDAELQIGFHLAMDDVIARIVTWMLMHLPEDRISFDFINQYQKLITRFKSNLYEKLETICSMDQGCIDDKVNELEGKGVPNELSKWVVLLPYLKDIMSIVAIKEERHANFIETGNLYIAVMGAFETDWISSVLENYRAETVWERMSVENLLRELEKHQSRLVLKIIDFKRTGENIDVAFTNYIREKAKAMTEYRETVEKVKQEKSNDLLAIGVLVRFLSRFK